jgi:hypothetical protein
MNNKLLRPEFYRATGKKPTPFPHLLACGARRYYTLSRGKRGKIFGSGENCSCL